MTATYGDYQRAIRQGREPTDDEREASRTYHREIRKRGGRTTESLRRSSTARARVLQRLADAHRDEYDTWYQEELARLPESATEAS